MKSQITKLVKEGITEEYVNTVIRLDPSKWNYEKEVMALKDLLLALQGAGVIQIIKA